MTIVLFLNCFFFSLLIIIFLLYISYFLKGGKYLLFNFIFLEYLKFVWLLLIFCFKIMKILLESKKLCYKFLIY